MRAVPRENDDTNESWISDRDRWGFHGLYADDRAHEPEIRHDDGAWRVTDWGGALDHAAELLKSVAPADIGFLLSGRSTNEELFLAQRVARSLGCENVDHRLRQIDFSGDAAGVGAPRFDLTIAELDQSDAIFIVGGNLRHEQPIIAHRIRQAGLRGGRIAQLNSVHYRAHYDTEHDLIVRPSALAGALASVVAGTGDGAPVAELLKAAGRGVIVLGATAMRHRNAATLRRLARRLAEATGAALCEVPDEANGAGAWRAGAVPDTGAGGLDTRAMIEAPRKVYLLFGFEPGADTAYGEKLKSALEGARVIHCGAFATDEIRELADVILPISPAPEAEGSVTNAGGSLQAFDAAGAPPGAARAGWKVLRVLGNALELSGFDFTRVEQVRDELVALAPPATASADTDDLEVPGVEEGTEVLFEVPIYAVDALVRRSQPLQETAHGGPERAALGAALADELGVGAGDTIEISLDDQTLRLPVHIDDRVATGVVAVSLGGVAADVTAAVSVRKADG
jgi:NADH-quinone oxidoreductase subunit G